MKESLFKRATKWAAKYFTHHASYYPVPVSHMSFTDLVYMTPLPSVEMSKENQQLMREWLEPYRPVRQRTVRSETTKDKAGALPPGVYAKGQDKYHTIQLDNDLATEHASGSSEEIDGTVDERDETAEPDEASENTQKDQSDQKDEYETDSDSYNEDLDQDELVLLRLQTTKVSRSGRVRKAAVRLDL